MLYQKYRPTEFTDIIGNDDTVQILDNMLKKPKDMPHAFLFYGNHGSGKTTLGRILARKLGATGNDYTELDSGVDRSIDNIRAIRKSSQFAPMEKESTARVYLLDEISMLGVGGASKKNAAQTALLKSLENPPDHVYYILCTTDPDMLLKTIKSRCTQFKVNNLNNKDMFKVLHRITKAENIKLNKKHFNLIIEKGKGHPRDTIQLLEQISNAPEDSRDNIIQTYEDAETQAIDLARALIKNEPWNKIKETLKGLKQEDVEGIRRMVMGYCSTILLNNANQTCAIIMEEFLEPFYNNGFPGLVYACYSIINGN